MQKQVNLVDLVKSFPTSIYLQNRRRYSRERAPRSLGENSIQYSFASLVTSVYRPKKSVERIKLKAEFEPDAKMVIVESRCGTAAFARPSSLLKQPSCNIFGRSVRGERANFTRLVLGCIEANFCK